MLRCAIPIGLKFVNIQLVRLLYFLFFVSVICFTEFELQSISRIQRLETRAAYWNQVSYFNDSVVCGLIWYIQVCLIHSGHLPQNFNLECVKAQHPLMPFIYNEAVRLFKKIIK